MIPVTVNIELDYDFTTLNQVLAMSSNIPQIAKAYEAWATVYRAAMQERFVAYSRGGGTWPELSPKTLARKRRGGKSANILRDTSVLFGTLNPTFGQPGQHQYLFDMGVEVGFNDGARYSDGSSVADIAGYHQYGTATIPARTILVEPEQKTKDLMATIMGQAIEDVLNV